MIKILKNLTKKEWGLAFIVFILVLFQVFLELSIPDYMSEITTLISSENSLLSDVVIAGSKMLACAFGSFLLAILVAIIAAKISANFSARIRNEIFSKVQSFSKEEINNFSTDSLITRTTNDVTQVQTLIIMGLQAMIKSPVMAVWAIIKILNKNLTWTYAVGVCVLVLVVIVGICLSLAVPKFRKIQELTDNLNRVTRENLSGLSVIRAYNAEEYQLNKFSKCNTKVTNNNMFANRTMSFLNPSITLINSSLVLSIYWIGSYLISSADASEIEVLFSDMIVFSSYGMQIIISFMILIMVFILLPRASVSAKRINEVLETKISITDGNGVKTNKKNLGTIEFKGVSFKYPDGDEYVLKDISFTANKGEVVAFIGATGSGKSALIDLIPRFFDASEGSVLVDGANVSSYKLKDLRDKIGYVSQKAILFSGTLKSNISFGDNQENVDDSKVKRASEISQAKEFVDSLSSKYDSEVSQGGKNLSGGQKQRISIARAIYKNPDILIFDDSFSALDYKTDKILRNELDKMCSDKTRLIVAQRIGTIRNADKIIVLENGEIVGMGKHGELMKKCEVYKEIALSQLSKKELENE